MTCSSMSHADTPQFPNFPTSGISLTPQQSIVLLGIFDIFRFFKPGSQMQWQTNTDCNGVLICL